MKYTLKPGNIAAVLHVTCGNSEPQTLCYMAQDKAPEIVTRPGYDGTAFFRSLPLSVRAAVNRHFGIVFSLPVYHRGEYVSNCQPETIEILPCIVDGCGEASLMPQSEYCQFHSKGQQ